MLVVLEMRDKRLIHHNRDLDVSRINNAWEKTNTPP